MLKEVVFPLLKPGIISGGLLVFLTTMKELPATLLLRPTGFNTLATRIWESTEEAFFARAGTSSLVLICVTLLAVSIIMRISPGLIEQEVEL